MNVTCVSAFLADICGDRNYALGGMKVIGYTDVIQVFFLILGGLGYHLHSAVTKVSRTLWKRRAY